MTRAEVDIAVDALMELSGEYPDAEMPDALILRAAATILLRRYKEKAEAERGNGD